MIFAHIHSAICLGTECLCDFLCAWECTGTCVLIERPEHSLQTVEKLCVQHIISTFHTPQRKSKDVKKTLHTLCYIFVKPAFMWPEWKSIITKKLPATCRTSEWSNLVPWCILNPLSQLWRVGDQTHSLNTWVRLYEMRVEWKGGR